MSDRYEHTEIPVRRHAVWLPRTAEFAEDNQSFQRYVQTELAEAIRSIGRETDRWLHPWKYPDRFRWRISTTPADWWPWWARPLGRVAEWLDAREVSP